MDVCNVATKNLYVSKANVRKTMNSDEDETAISDLAADIRTNGLLNPLTVRKASGNKYEIIAGQRRFLAIKENGDKTIPCHIMTVSDQKAEELSLVENVQRNQMTAGDKVRAYSKLYDVYNKDDDKVASVVHISRRTITKYLKIRELPSDILDMLDKIGNDKITINVAVELSSLPHDTEFCKIINKLSELTSQQKIKALKEYKRENTQDLKILKFIAQKIVLSDSNINLAPSFPYVIDQKGKFVKIPEDLFENIINLIKKTKKHLEYI